MNNENGNNNEKDFRKMIDSRLSSMSVSNELEEKIFLGTRAKRTLRKRPMMIAAVICIIVLISVPVMANTAAFQNLLALVSPKTAEKLQPIQLVSESNGIKLEIIAAINDGKSAVVYYTLKDMTDQGRIGKGNKELLGNLVISKGLIGGQGFLVAYDESTNTATYRMYVFPNNRTNNEMSVASTMEMQYLYQDRVYVGDYKNTIDTGIKILDIVSKNPETIELLQSEVHSRGDEYNGNKTLTGRFSIEEELKSKGKATILKNDVMNIKIPEVDFLTISNAGFIDGKLHVQFRATDSKDMNPFEIFFKLKDGRRAETVMMNFNVEEKGRVRIGGMSYYEYAFDVNEEDLINSSIQGWFSNHKCIVGDWKINFKLNKVNLTEKTAENVDLGSFVADKISFSPLGLFIEGKGKVDYRDIPDIRIENKDGTVLDKNEKYNEKIMGFIKFDDDRYLFENRFNDWYDIDDLKELRINGKLIDLK